LSSSSRSLAAIIAVSGLPAQQVRRETKVIKDIVVHLTGSQEDEVRLAYAEAIGARFDAHLTGLYAHILPEVIGGDGVALIAMEPLIEQSNEQADATLDRLVQRFDRLTMPHEVRRLDAFSGMAGDALAVEARTADLFVATRPYGDPADAVNMEVAVLFGSGRACLFVPPKAQTPYSFGTVVVAWNGSRESARAVAEAMPFLKLAGQVIVVMVGEGEATASGGDIARHLSRHGISAVIGTAEAGSDGAGEALLAEVRRVGAGLLVMGGYGHSRLREWILGGTTRHILANADVPVLMAR